MKNKIYFETILCLNRKRKDMNIQYSVIIPVYNAEKTIARCLKSLLNSARSDFEILVIDDGSTDHTLNICQNIMERDTRIRYYRKQNGGVSSARNFGLKYAVGNYICFVDSDDFVTWDYFDQLTFALKNNPDLLIFGRKIFDGQRYELKKYKTCFITNQNQLVSFMCSELRNQQLNFVGNKLFRRELLEKYRILFPEQLHIGEDKVFVVRYVVNIRNVKCIEIPLYNSSIENKESLSRKVKKDLYKSAILEHVLMRDGIISSKLLGMFKKQYLSAMVFSYYRSAYTAIGEIAKVPLNRSERRKINRSICKQYKVCSNRHLFNIVNWLVALPVKLEWITLISFIMKWKSWWNFDKG